MRVLESKGNLTAAEQYYLTVAPNIQKMSAVKGQTLDVDKWCIYTAVNDKTGEEFELVSIMTPEHEVYATNSKTFVQTFRQIVEIFGTDGFNRITVGSGMSKAGREFVTAIYAE